MDGQIDRNICDKQTGRNICDGVYLVLRVVNHRRVPFALVVGVGDAGSLPHSTPWGSLALGVGHLRRLPLTILFLIPVLWLLSLCITMTTELTKQDQSTRGLLSTYCTSSEGNCSGTKTVSSSAGQAESVVRPEALLNEHNRLHTVLSVVLSESTAAKRNAAGQSCMEKFSKDQPQHDAQTICSTEHLQSNRPVMIRQGTADKQYASQDGDICRTG